MAKKDKELKEEVGETEEVVKAMKDAKPSLPAFICNVNFNNKEYKVGEVFDGEVTEVIRKFLK